MSPEDRRSEGLRSMEAAWTEVVVTELVEKLGRFARWSGGRGAKFLLLVLEVADTVTDKTESINTYTLRVHHGTMVDGDRESKVKTRVA